VLHIDTERGWRGGQRQTLWLARALVALGHRSIVAARGGEPLEARVRQAGIDTIAVRPWSEVAVATARSLRRVIREREVDIVHAHSGHAVSLAALAARGTGAKIVVTRRVTAPLRRNIGTRWKYGRADRLIAVSRAIADTLKAGGIEEQRVCVVHDGVDLGRSVTPASRDAVAALGVPDGAPWVVQVAALDPGKDPLTFVRAVAAARRTIPSLSGVLVGTGREESAVRAEIDRLTLDGVVHLAGYRSDADALIAAASVATLTSVQEGLGTVLLDAMAFGTPVAATRAGGIPEIVRHEETGLLAPPGDADALGAAIVRLVSHRQLADRLTRNARRFVEGLTVERMAERTVEEYRLALQSA
jgi:glycosyltransferase involved in cell wall biosynthesis